ncbi:MAG: arsenate reductase (glutaredoxin) [Crocinitomicaceae bacterium]|nr:arsenate reductase (glutaredoxin) [Crocinitomicaceae bacterium]
MGKNTYTVYHNNRCSKSRLALAHLDDKNAEYEVVEYLKNPLTAADLKEVLSQLGMPAADLIRKGEKDFKENFKGKNLSEKEWIDAMIQYPKLIERPIIVKNGKAVVGRPTERIDEL